MSKINALENIVSVTWLNNHLQDENILVFDATISKVVGDISALSNSKIPGSQFFDIKKKFSIANSSFPNTIPSAEQFEKNVQALGVNNDSIIVIYDDHGIYSSARAWWLFKTFGFNNVAVLDGGLPEWKAKDFSLEDKATNHSHKKGNFKAIYKPNNVVYFESLEAISKDDNYKIIDARSSDRFNCIVAEPRVGLRSGIIPSSSNLPFNKVLDENKLKPKKELQTVFKNLAKKDQHLVFSCGSGITASVLALAATVAGYNNSVYDGSWTEYGSLTIA
ncbi:sulfurtransferase [Lacinutrix sp. Bg11-31]|uniref:sulfurtransferase n=1 Tax=Lacinutrix sp. Bg11-31 TaxID=2057808 RepID=UPI000C30928B|nr:sulfurtransferase [Lacinutrix sp. Bg11-31]AUC81528.1 sulfurtransferase [Lacinutrix sp. Bg11-31]